MLITEPTPYDELIDVSIAIDPERERTALLYTNGLPRFGARDLAIEPPEGFAPEDPEDWPHLSQFLAHALWTMAVAVLDARGADRPEVLPLITGYRGREVAFWLSEEGPRGRAILELADPADPAHDLVEVACSLWWPAQILS